MEHESNGDTNYEWNAWTVLTVFKKWQDELVIRKRIEHIQITALLRTIRIPRRLVETWGHLLGKNH